MGWERSSSSLASTVAAVEPPTTPPKLSYYTLPSLRPDPPGMATPPINVPGSIPFRWEEAPGKPKRPSDYRHPAGPHLPPRPVTKPSAAKALDLPPRMLAEEMKASAPSPTAVLDGPYPFAETGRPVSKSLKRATSKGRRSCELSSASPSSLSSSSRSSSTGSGHYGHISGCRFGFGVGGGGEREAEEEHATTNVTISRISRSKSASVLPSTSHWSANLYRSLRKVIQRRTNIKS